MLPTSSPPAPRRNALLVWTAPILSAASLELPFPLAGPLPAWRTIFAYIGLIPLLFMLLHPASARAPRPFRRAFLLAYLCGVLWYAGNCYWIYDTMLLHGGLPPSVSFLLLLGFSLMLGLYFGIFGLGVVAVRRWTGSTRWALAAVPFLWVAQELATSRITCFPWDQLGDSQVDNLLLTQLVPWTGVYGISFVLAAANALMAGGFLLEHSGSSRWSPRRRWSVAGVVLMTICGLGVTLPAPQPAATATAVLVQPNLDVSANNSWGKLDEWQAHMLQYRDLSNTRCTPSIAGIPETGAPTVQTDCAAAATPPDLVAWPESPAWFLEQEPRFREALRQTATYTHAPMIVGANGMNADPATGEWTNYNSAVLADATGRQTGRYDKIHLVPYGEYIPFQDFFAFARPLTGKISSFGRGGERTAWTLTNQAGASHRFGIFICYEAVFASEVRLFAKNGAEVFVNISDDGWYGDTSAPWQHLNMARMRAMENRRWILRDTNNGITAAIDPYGRVRQSIPRHAVGALAARFGYSTALTFYTLHSDVFAWLCAILTVGVLGWALRQSRRS